MLSLVSCLRLFSTKSMFYTLSLTSLCAVLHVWTSNAIPDYPDNISLTNFTTPIITVPTIKPYPNTIRRHEYVHILSWDHKYLANVANNFHNLKCPVNTCAFITDKTLFNVTAFGAIVFDESFLASKNRPHDRSPHQIFVFMSIASSYNYPACKANNDNYFNWTYTLRPDSDFIWSHYVVRDLAGTLVAPSKHVVWMNSSDPLKSEVKSILRSKTRPIIWIMDKPSTKTYEYLMILQKHLHELALKLYRYKNFKKNSIYVDVLSRNYQFVLAFDNENFMSKNLIEGYRNYAVPIVYSTIDYRRFLPPGSYINAFQMDPYDLAQAINNASKNLTLYEDYFRWTNVYSVEEPDPEHSCLCHLCASLHGATRAPTVEHFRSLGDTTNS